MKTKLLCFLLIVLSISCKKSGVAEPGEPPVAVVPGSLSASLISNNGFQLNWVFTGKDSVKVFVARDSLFTKPVNGFNGVATIDNKLQITGLSPDSSFFCQVKTKDGLSSSLLKVTTNACLLLSVSFDREPVTIPQTQLQMQYDNQNRLIKTITIGGNGTPSLTSDISYGSNGSIASIKETNNLSGGAIFNISVQGNIITGTGKRASNSLYDTLRIEMTPTGFSKIERLVSAFLTGIAPSDTLKIITERSFSYDNTGLLTKSITRETTERISSTGVKQTTSFTEKEFSYQYLNGNLQKVEFSQRTQPNAAAVLQTIIEYQYELNRLHPKNFILGGAAGFAVGGTDNIIKGKGINFPAIMSNPVNLVKSIKITFVDPLNSTSQTNDTFEYGFRNGAFPESVKVTSTRTSRSTGATTANGTPIFFIYSTSCN